MRFHLIDRVDSWEVGHSVRGRKLTSLSEEYWEDGGDGLEMPPPLILEALCQAGTWLIMITTERRKRAALLSIGTVDFIAPVRPGDVLVLEGEVDSMTVEERPVLEAKDIMCALIDAGDLADLDDTERLQKMLTRAES